MYNNRNEFSEFSPEEDFNLGSIDDFIDGFDDFLGEADTDSAEELSDWDEHLPDDLPADGETVPPIEELHALGDSPSAQCSQQSSATGYGLIEAGTAGSGKANAPEQPVFRRPNPKIEFSELTPLVRELPAPIKFPTDSLNGLLQSVIKKTAALVQVPEALAGNSILAAVALAVQPHANVSIDDRSYPISEYFVTIAESGDRKDATDDVVLSPVREHQKKLATSYAELNREYSNDKEAYEKVRTAAIKECKAHGRERLKEEIRKVGEPPQPPQQPLKLTSDLTIEGLTKLLLTGQPSIGIFGTEGGQLVGGHSFAKENVVKTAAGLSKFWDGKPVDKVRAGDGVTLLYDRRVSMHLMIQPVLAPMLIGNKLIDGQGLPSRFLVAWPESLAGTRISPESSSVPRETIETCAEIQDYYKRMKDLLEAPEPLQDGKTNELNPRKIRPDHEASELLDRFYNDTELQQGKDGPLRSIKPLASKIAQHAARLAAILALFNDLNCPSINAETMESGIALARYYLAEALRLHGASVDNPRLREAKDLYDWLIAKNKYEVTLIEVYKCGPAWIRDAQKARALADILIEHGYMAKLPDGLEYEGTHRTEAYLVRDLGG